MIKSYKEIRGMREDNMKNMIKMVAANLASVLFLICFMAGGVNASLTDSPTQVPEPSTLLLIGSGLIGLFTIARKIKNNK